MINNNTSKAVFNGNGVATEFPFTFKVWEKGQLLVEITDLESKDSFATVWDVVLTENGGVVTYLHEGAPLPVGYKLTILRNMPFLQEVDLINGTRFDPSVIEVQLDKATAERQQLREEINRAIKVPASSSDPSELLAQEIFDARDQANTSASNAALSAAESAASAASAQDSLTQAQELLPQIESAVNAGVEAVGSATQEAIVQAESAVTAAKEAAVTAVAEEVEKAEGWSSRAQAWAESDTPPDPSDPASRSAKWWAQQGGQGIPDATTTTKGKVRIATDAEAEGGSGEGVIVAAQLSRVNDGINAAQGAATEAKEAAQTAGASASTAEEKATAAASTAQQALGMFSLTKAPNKSPIAGPTGEFDDSWKMGGGGGMPIGASIAVYCTSTYTPFGAVPQDGASYSESQFPNVVEYIEDGFIPWVSPTDYEAEVAAHGKCGCFAWDSTARTFRVPLIPDGTFVQQAMSDSELGKSYEAGLPSIAGSFALSGTRSDGGSFADGIFEIENVASLKGQGANEYSITPKVKVVDGEVYGNSDTVQPSAISLRHFVVVATETDQQSVMDWSAWASALGGKANTDLSNIADAGRSVASGFGMPSNEEITGFSYPYTTPANGFLVIEARGGSSGVGRISVLGLQYTVATGVLGSTGRIPVLKGTVIAAPTYLSATGSTNRFIYAQGEI